MKLCGPLFLVCAVGRAPYGARGLKRVSRQRIPRTATPRPVRGAWVETSVRVPPIYPATAAPRTGRVG